MIWWHYMMWCTKSRRTILPSLFCQHYTHIYIQQIVTTPDHTMNSVVLHIYIYLHDAQMCPGSPVHERVDPLRMFRIDLRTLFNIMKVWYMIHDSNETSRTGASQNYCEFSYTTVVLHKSTRANTQAAAENMLQTATVPNSQRSRTTSIQQIRAWQKKERGKH